MIADLTLDDLVLPEESIPIPKTKPKFQAMNKEQSDAIEAIKDFLLNGSTREWFCLTGKAGTGKTTIIQEAVADAIKANQSVLVLAVAHKAKKVLEKKMKDRFGLGAPIGAKSVAGALGMSMHPETGKFTKAYGTFLKPIEQYDIIIVDEASMVNEDALELIMDEKRFNSKVIFLGDVGQLPAIREKRDPNEHKPSPVFNTPNIAALVERVRQGEESPILPFADKYWANSQELVPVKVPTVGTDYVNAVTPQGALVFTKNLADAVIAVLPLYREAVDTNDPDRIKTVVYRNAPKNEINQYIRKYLFKELAEEQYTQGDFVNFSDNYALGKDNIIENATEGQVTRVEKYLDRGKYRAWRVTIKRDDGRMLTIAAIDVTEKSKHALDVSVLFDKAARLSRGQKRTAAYAAAWDEQKYYAPLDYSYVITSHKAQGSTYAAVVVGASDIMGVTPTSNANKSQSMYTAITRAATTAIVANGTPTDPEALAEAVNLLTKSSE